jgi:RHS repeat-associated protein
VKLRPDYDDSLVRRPNISTLILALAVLSFLLGFGRISAAIECPAQLDPVAEALGNDPVRIYEFVRNEVEFEPYFGLKKGSVSTFDTLAGNDYDIASLLGALLVCAGYEDVSYVRGRIEISDAAAMSWLGTASGIGAFNLLQSSEPENWGPLGVQRTANIISKTHIWIRIGVSRTAYRGVAGVAPISSADTLWVNLDASFKASDWPEPHEIPLGTEGLQVEMDPNEESSLFSKVRVERPFEIFQDQIRDWLGAEYSSSPNSTAKSVQELTSGASIKKEWAGVLPLSLPYVLASSVPTRVSGDLAAIHPGPGFSPPSSACGGTACLWDLEQAPPERSSSFAHVTVVYVCDADKVSDQDCLDDEASPPVWGNAANVATGLNGPPGNRFKFAEFTRNTADLGRKSIVVWMTAVREEESSQTQANWAETHWNRVQVNNDPEQYAPRRALVNVAILDPSASPSLAGIPLNDPPGGYDPNYPFTACPNGDGCYFSARACFGQTDEGNNLRTHNLRIRVQERPPYGRFDGGPTDAATQILSSDHTVSPFGVYVVSGVESGSSFDSARIAREAILAASNTYPIAQVAGENGGDAFVDHDRDQNYDSADQDLKDEPTIRATLIGTVLHAGREAYWAEERRVRKKLQSLHHIADVSTEHAGVGLLSSNGAVGYLSDLPVGLMASDLLIDLGSVAVSAVDRATGTAAEAVRRRSFFHQLGHAGSAGEHELWESLVGSESMSSVRGLQVAQELIDGNEVITIDSVADAMAATNSCSSPNQGCSEIDRTTYCTIKSYFGESEWRQTNWDDDCSEHPGAAPQDGAETLVLAKRSMLDDYGGWSGHVYIHHSATQSSYIIESSDGSAAGGGWATQNFFNPISYGIGQSPINSAYFQVAGINFSYQSREFSPDLFRQPVRFDSVFHGNQAAATALIADPVAIATGEYLTEEVDFSIEARGPSRIELRRGYRTGLDYEGPLGHGWVHTFDQHLFLRAAVEDGEENEDQDELVWQRESSYQLAWEVLGNGRYRSGPSNHAVLEDAGGGRFKIRELDGTVYLFGQADVDGRSDLLSITDRRGHALTLNYDPSGRLVSVVDSASRELAFHYDGSGHLQEVVDWTGRSVRYDVDTEAHLVSVWSPEQWERELATPGSGLPYRYQYWSDPDFTALNHNLKCWIKPQGGRIAPPTVPPLCGAAAGGHAWTHFNYYDNGRVRSHTDALGRTTHFSYDNYRRETAVEHPDGTIEIHRYDPHGNIVRHTDGRGAITSYSYDEERRELLSVMDDFGFKTEMTYSDKGLPMTRKNQLGFTEEFSYDQFGQLSSHRDARGKRRLWSFDGMGNLRNERAEISGVTQILASYRYDAFGNPTERLEYSDAQEPPARYELQYDSAGIGLARVINPLGQIVRYVNDDLGRPIEVATDRTIVREGTQVRMPFIERLEYDADDRVTRRTAPSGVGNLTVYDADNLPLVSSTVPFAQAGVAAPPRYDAIMEYDVMGHVVGRTDGAGGKTTYQYDLRDRVVLERSPLGREARREYDENGNLIGLVDPAGGRSTFAYDPLNRQTSSIDALGRVSRREYDPAGQLIREYGPGNAGERLLRRHEYDPAGNPIRSWDEASTLTKTDFDDLGRIDHVTRAVGLPEEVTVSFEYDLQGRTTARVDGNQNRTEIEYDLMGREQLVRDPLGNARSQSYDEIGSVIGTLDAAGKALSFEYNERGLLARRVSAEADVDDRFAYDKFGRLIYAANALTTLSYEYDAVDRVVSTTDHNTRGGTARVTYDVDGFVTQLISPESTFLPGHPIEADVTHYRWSPRGEIESIDNAQFGSMLYEHDAIGRRTRELLPRGLVRELDYTAEGYLSEIALLAGGVQQDRRTYSDFDELGNPQRLDIVEGSSGPTTTQHYAYDALSRLRSADYGGTAGSETFEYDDAGNRRYHTLRSGIALEYFYDAADQLTGIRLDAPSPGNIVVASFEYDLAGRRTKSTMGSVVSQYAYDSAGRLISVASPATSYVTALGYDANGERRRRQETGVSEFYAVGEWAEWRGSEHHKLIHAPGIDRVVGEVVYSSGALQARFLHQDLQGTVVLDARWVPGVSTDAVIGSPPSTYEAFGSEYGLSNPALRTRGFAGRPIEGSTKLVYLRARHYDTQTGTFLQRDPLFIQTGWSYAYANQNPIRYLDPTGLFGETHSVTGAGVGPRYPFQFEPGAAGSGLVRGGHYIQSPNVSFIGYGDNRGINPYASSADYRILIEANLEAGTGFIQSNPSCVVVFGCYEPLPFNTDPSGNRFQVTSMGPGRLLISIINAHNGAPDIGLGAIDSTIYIEGNGASPATGAASLEPFPAFQLHQFQQGRVTELLNFNETPAFDPGLPWTPNYVRWSTIPDLRIDESERETVGFEPKPLGN